MIGLASSLPGRYSENIYTLHDFGAAGQGITKVEAASHARRRR
jgi:hypothetical protein